MCRKGKWKAKLSTFSQAGCRMLHISIAGVRGLGEAVHSFCGVLPCVRGLQILCYCWSQSCLLFPLLLERRVFRNLLWKVPLNDGLVTSFIPSCLTDKRCRTIPVQMWNGKISPDSCQWSALSGWLFHDSFSVQFFMTSVSSSSPVHVTPFVVILQPLLKTQDEFDQWLPGDALQGVGW